MPRPNTPWFVVLPDAERGAAIAARLRELRPGLTEITHPSGRPWLLGSWPPWRLAVGRARDTVIALVGEHTVADDELEALAARARTAADLDRVYHRAGGSVHLVASASGLVRVQGTASGLRRVFHCDLGGITVAADRADLLAELRGLGAADPARLATRLCLGPPWPLAGRTMWREVEAVPPGHTLTLSPYGEARADRWWTPPELAVTKSEGILAFRRALIAAVRTRARPGTTVVSHLSGLDSSSVCSIAAREGAHVVAMTAAQPDAMDQDVLWARRTAVALGEAGLDVAHDVIPAEECPLVFDGMLAARDVFDQPFTLLHNRRRFQHIVRRGERHAPRTHLTGLGGDEMTIAQPAWLHTLLKSSPRLAVRHLRATSARHRWSYRDLVRHLLVGRTHASWLRAAARAVDGAAPADQEPNTGWDTVPVLPLWATPEAVEMVRHELRAAAERPSALAADRGTHYTLKLVHAGAQAVRAFQQIAAADGALLSAPFFDDAVLNAALAVRVADRYDPARYKPLLADAMDGIVPAATLGRTTKSDTAASAVMGSRRHRSELVALAHDSRLAGLGLIDRDRFLHAVHGPVEVATGRGRIEPTLACEMWLRTLEETADVHAGA